MNTNSSVESIASQIDFSRTAARRIASDADARRPVFAENRADDKEAVSGGKVLEIAESSLVMPGDDVAQSEENDKTEQSTKAVNEEASKRLAEQLEEALNEANGTRVKFQVRNGTEDENTFNFAVIDKETGEIVREFPPRELMAATERARAQSGHGVFVDESA